MNSPGLQDKTTKYLERIKLDIILNRFIRPFSTNQPLGVKDSVLGIAGQLILGRISDQSLAFSGESHVAGGDTVALVISNDLNTSILENSNTEKYKI